MKNKLFRYNQKIERRNRINEGFFDGRFAPKIYLDKKKNNNKKLSRLKVNLLDY